MLNTAHSKAALRKEMVALRNSLEEADMEEMSSAIEKRLLGLDEFKAAKCVAFYLSKSSEVRTAGMINAALAAGKEVLVPVTNHEIEFVKFTSFQDLVPGRFGVPEPRTHIKSALEPEVVVLPGLAFDLDMHRLGYGKAYYDRALKNMKAIRIGICFDAQIVEIIPRHAHDEKMDIIVSEKRVLK